MADGVPGPLEQCAPTLSDDCSQLANGGGIRSFALAGVANVRLELYCPAYPCRYGLGDQPSAAAVLRSSTVTVSETTLPAASTPVVAGLNDGWALPGSTITFAGSDSLGLRKVEAVKPLTASDYGAVASKDGVCVDWSVRPCVDGPGGSTGLSSTQSVSSLGLVEGTHSLRTRARDAAGNESLSGPVEVKVDTIAPIPAGVNGGGGSSEVGRTISWGLPAGGSPLASGTVKLCRVSDGHCETFSVSPAGPFGFSIPAWGDVMATVSLKDAAGNTGTAAPIRLTYEAPTAASPTPAAAPTPTPAPTSTPTAGIHDPKRLVLTATFPKKLGRRSVLVTGATSAGSTTAVTLRLTGKRTNGKTFRVYKTVKPESSGSWQARAKLPRDIRRRSGVKASVTASPRPGWITPSVARQLLR